MGVRGILGVMVVVVMGAVFYGAVATEPDTPLVPDPANAALVALGKLAYDQHCASCHGINMEGQPGWGESRPDGTLPAPPHNADGHTWHHSNGQILAIIRDGGAAAPGAASGMPAFKGVLSEREIVGTLAYIKSRWPQPIRDRQARINAQAVRAGKP